MVEDSLTVYDGDGNVLLQGVNQGDDLWSCEEKLLLKRSVNAYKNDATIEPEPLTSEITLNGSELEEQRIVVDVPQFTADERRRAREAFNLCAILRHPGDHAMLMALDGGTFAQNHLTAQDFRNGRRLFGPCPACTEGKMRAPRAQT